MSFNRENVIWQSADGTWGRGFYESSSTGSYDDEEYDPEWDVDYDYDRFEWVSVGHSTEQAARASWDGENPGGSASFAFGDSGMFTSEPIAPRFDDMAVQCAASGRYAQGVSPVKVQDAKDRGTISRFYFTQRAYDPRTGELSSYFAADDEEEVKAVTALLQRRPELAEYARECRQKLSAGQDEKLVKARTRAAESARWGGRSTAVADVIANTTSLNKLLDRVKVPAAPKADSASAGAGRGKTTAASTAGSFAPKTGLPPSVTL